mgnify:CR=1 FL=1
MSLSRDAVNGLQTNQLAGIADQTVLVEETGFVDFAHVSGRLAGIGFDGSFRGGTNGEFEAFHVAVAEFDGPHDGIRAAQRLNRAAHGHDIGISTNFDGILRTNLYIRS